MTANNRFLTATVSISLATNKPFTYLAKLMTTSFNLMLLVCKKFDGIL